MMKKNNRYSLYEKALYRDISNNIKFHILRNKSENIEIKNLKGNFKDYFYYKNNKYIEYELIDEIIKLIISLLERGHAEAIIAKYKDEKNVIKGIEIKAPYYKYRIIGIKNIYFFQKQNDIGVSKKYYFNKIKKQDIILINFKKINLSRKNIRKIIKKLRKDEFEMKLLDLYHKKLISYEELEKNKENKIVKIFKDTKYIGWNANELGKDYFCFPYIMYRETKFLQVLIKIFTEILNLINNNINKQEYIECKRGNRSVY